jgi:hypothetical protein
VVDSAEFRSGMRTLMLKRTSHIPASFDDQAR